MLKLRMKPICVMAVIIGIGLFLLTDAEAKTNFARKSKKTAIEESPELKTEAELEQCRHDSETKADCPNCPKKHEQCQQGSETKAKCPNCPKKHEQCQQGSETNAKCQNCPKKHGQCQQGSATKAKCQNCPKKHEQCQQGSATKGQCPNCPKKQGQCQQGPAEQAQPEARRRWIGDGPVTSILAFGNRVNYDITDWILADK